MSKIQLPKKIQVATSINPKNLILVGAPKVGKTTFAAELTRKFEGEAIILDLENGTGFVDSLSYPITSITELGNFLKAVEDANKPYKYIIVDTVTALEDMCEMVATYNYMKKPIGASFNRVPGKPDVIKPVDQWESVLNLPRGAGYLYLREEVKKWFKRISNACEHAIFLGHVKDSFLNIDGKEEAVKMIDLTGKIKTILAQDADAIGFLERDSKTGNLKISFVNTLTEAGSRCPHLKNLVIDADWDKIFLK